MQSKSLQTIVTALFTGLALVGLAVYERYVGPVRVSGSAFYLVAALICVSPALFYGVRCKMGKGDPRRN